MITIENTETQSSRTPSNPDRRARQAVPVHDLSRLPYHHTEQIVLEAGRLSEYKVGQLLLLVVVMVVVYRVLASRQRHVQSRGAHRSVSRQ